MIHALHALREKHELLLNAMKVFIQEPSLDWIENAKKMALNQLKEVSEFSLEESLSAESGKKFSYILILIS